MVCPVAGLIVAIAMILIRLDWRKYESGVARGTAATRSVVSDVLLYCFTTFPARLPAGEQEVIPVGPSLRRELTIRMEWISDIGSAGVSRAFPRCQARKSQ